MRFSLGTAFGVSLCIGINRRTSFAECIQPHVRFFLGTAFGVSLCIGIYRRTSFAECIQPHVRFLLGTAVGVSLCIGNCGGLYSRAGAPTHRLGHRPYFLCVMGISRLTGAGDSFVSSRSGPRCVSTVLRYGIVTGRVSNV